MRASTQSTSRPTTSPSSGSRHSCSTPRPGRDWLSLRKLRSSVVAYFSCVRAYRRPFWCGVGLRRGNRIAGAVVTVLPLVGLRGARDRGVPRTFRAAWSSASRGASPGRLEQVDWLHTECTSDPTEGREGDVGAASFESLNVAKLDAECLGKPFLRQPLGRPHFGNASAHVADEIVVASAALRAHCSAQSFDQRRKITITRYRILGARPRVSLAPDSPRSRHEFV